VPTFPQQWHYRMQSSGLQCIAAQSKCRVPSELHGVTSQKPCTLQFICHLYVCSFMTWVTSYNRELFRFEVFIGVKIHIILLWAMKPYSLVSIHLEEYSVEDYIGFTGTYGCQGAELYHFDPFSLFHNLVKQIIFNVLMAVNIKKDVFWNVTTCSVL
jgi:hypothetical protein